MKSISVFKRRKFKRILKKSSEGLTIFVRKDPSADSLASAFALKKIAEHFHINSKCYYSGTVHNRSLLNIMGADIMPLPDDINDKIPGKVALVDVLPSELPESHNKIIGTPTIIISHSKAAAKDIQAQYKDVRANVETTSSIMVQYMKSLKIPMEKPIATMLLYAIRDRTKTFLTNINRKGLDAYMYVLGYMDHDLLIKLEKPSVKSETFNDLALAINNRNIKDEYLLTNTGYIKDPTTLPKVCKYMLDLAGISTALVFAVNTSKIYIYAATENIEINLKHVFKKAFGQCGNIIGTSSNASITIPLGLFGVITGDVHGIDSKKMMLDTISEAISSRFFKALEEGEGELEK